MVSTLWIYSTVHITYWTAVAFLDKTRKAYREGRSLTDEHQYEENVRLAHDVAVVLRTNVVQGQRGADRDVWGRVHPCQILQPYSPSPELKLHRHSELGDNNTIKSPSQSRANVKTEQVPWKGMIFHEFSPLRLISKFKLAHPWQPKHKPHSRKKSTFRPWKDYAEGVTCRNLTSAI